MGQFYMVVSDVIYQGMVLWVIAPVSLPTWAVFANGGYGDMPGGRAYAWWARWTFIKPFQEEELLNAIWQMYTFKALLHQTYLCGKPCEYRVYWSCKRVACNRFTVLMCGEVVLVKNTAHYIISLKRPNAAFCASKLCCDSGLLGRFFLVMKGAYTGAVSSQGR